MRRSRIAHLVVAWICCTAYCGVCRSVAQSTSGSDERLLWVDECLLPGEKVLDLRAEPAIRSPGSGVMHESGSAPLVQWYRLTVQSSEDSLAGRTMHVAVAGDSVLVDSASLWLVSDYARDGGRVAVLEPVTHEQARRAIDLVAPTLEPGESIYRVGPAEQLDVDAGRFQSVALPGTVDVAVSRGVNEGGRLMAVETLADSVRVYQRGVIMH